MLNINYLDNKFTLSSDECFNDLKNKINNDDIVGFYSDNGTSVSLKSKAEVFSSFKEVNLFPVYKKNAVANLMNAFVNVLKCELVNFEFLESGFWIKVKSDKNYSTLEFPDFCKQVKKLKGISIDPLLKDLVNSSLYPSFFEFQTIAQEEYSGEKVQKISFISFFNKEEMDSYKKRLEALKKNDHRLLGQQQGLFNMIPDAPGSVFWLPNGWKVYRKLEAFIRKNGYEGYQEVRTPFVMANNFWKKSGHMDAYKQNMMFVNMGDKKIEESALKPMNCPGHFELFKMKNRSYKDLPYRVAEFGCCHRYEPSGSLHGLMRVRSLTIDDGHIFCSVNQIESETSFFLSKAIDIYKKLGFSDFKIALATRPEGFLGEISDWNLAEKSLRGALDGLNIEYETLEGEGAFYGPKVEMHVKDSMGRSWQLGTIQLDFVLPKKMDISYVNAQDKKEVPCVLHRAILGSIERFIGVLLEHTEGKLPLFLHPNPIVICSVTSSVNDYAKSVYDIMKKEGLESSLDIREQTLSYKIREHRLAKIPIVVILGSREMEGDTITVEYMNKKMSMKKDQLEEIKRLFNESI